MSRQNRLQVAIARLAAATLALIGWGATCEGSDAAGPPKHLYVASIYTDYQPFNFSVERFPLRDGVPLETPDFTYGGAYGPIWVDRAGDLYAQLPSPFFPALVEYAPDSTTVLRTIDTMLLNYPSLNNPTVFSGLLVGPAGDAFLASQWQDETPDMLCGWQISVYAPGASGVAAPQRCLPSAAPLSMSKDSAGNLYVAASTIAADAVFVFERPAEAPRISRILYGPSFSSPVATAIDADELLYVLNSCSGGCDGPFVAVYPQGGDGIVTPIRVLNAPAHAQWSGAIAVDAQYLYVATGIKVLVFDKNATGHAKPLATLQYKANNITFVALGP
jgi:hypothetical protein